MSVKIFPPGPKYFENYDKIAWDKPQPKQEDEGDSRQSKDSLQELRSSN
jgi:hypothetical protein